jgi:hypothetical protein
MRAKWYFWLESGYHGGMWIDLDPLAERLKRHNSKAVSGPLVGGAFLAQALASFLHIEFYYTMRLLAKTGR